MLFTLSSKGKIEVEALVLKPVIILKTINILCYLPFAVYGDFSYFKNLCISRKSHWLLCGLHSVHIAYSTDCFTWAQGPRDRCSPRLSCFSRSAVLKILGIKAPSHWKWRMPESFCLCRLYLSMFTLFSSQFKEILIIYVNNNTLDFSFFGCPSWHADS